VQLHIWKDYIKKTIKSNMCPAISSLKFPFVLKPDQVAAVDSWIKNGYRGSVIYSTGTGKTEIAYEGARRACIEYVRNTQLKDNLKSSKRIINYCHLPAYK